MQQKYKAIIMIEKVKDSSNSFPPAKVEELIETIPCKQCDFTATSKAKLSQHKKTAHVKLVCLRCNDTTEEFPDKKKLNQHNIQVHQVGHFFVLTSLFYSLPTRRESIALIAVSAQSIKLLCRGTR